MAEEAPKKPALNKKIVELLKAASEDEIEEILTSQESLLASAHQMNNNRVVDEKK